MFRKIMMMALSMMIAMIVMMIMK